MVLTDAARTARRWAAAGLTGLALLGAGPAGAGANVHDGLRSATPGDGDTLAVVPDTLRLVFTRAQNLELASVTLAGPGGELGVGALRAHPDSAAVVLVPVEGPWTAGAHEVRWRIVGRDGHPVSGSYRFVVAEGARGLVEPEGAAPQGVEGAATPPPPGPEGAATPIADGFGVSSPPYVAVRWLNFLALLGVIGAATWGLLVVPLAERNGASAAAAAGRPRAAAVGMLAGALVLVGAGARLWAQARALGVGEAAPPGALGTVLGSTAWGAGWWLQVAAGAVALAAFAGARRSAGRAPWAAAGGATLALAFTPSLSGHAVAVEELQALAVLADGVHVLAAGGWMGGLLLLVAVGLPLARGGGDDRRALVPVVEAFSLTALVFAALLVLTGAFSAWLHLGSLDALWGSPYGRALGLKLLLLLPLFATGAYNWLRVRPALAEGDAGAARLRASGAAELTVALAVLLATAVLVATPPPVETDGAAMAEAPATTSTPSSETLP